MSKESIFRKVSVERLSSPEQLDQLVTVVSPKGWIALFSAIFLLIVTVFWGVYGRIPQKVTGNGILMKSGGIRSISHLNGGRVTDIKLNVGDTIEKGDIIARVAAPDILSEIERKKFDLSELQKELNRKSQILSKSSTMKKDTIKRQKENIQTEIANAKINLAHLAKKLKVQEELLKQGGITNQELVDTRNQYESLNLSIQNNLNRLKELDLQDSELDNTNEDQRIDLRNRIENLRLDISFLQERLDASSKVVSNYSGKIVEIMTNRGAILAAGGVVASIAIEGGDSKDLEATVFVATVEGKKIMPGMDVQIVPSNIKKEEYGALLGRVVSVSSFPVTLQYAANILGNEDLARSFIDQGLNIQVKVDLIPNLNNESGYDWTSRKGPPVQINNGTICEASIIVNKERPIALVFPILKSVR